MLYPLDHIGIAVLNLDASIKFHQDNFGLKLELRENIESQRVEIAFLKLENTLLELLAPTDSNSTLSKFLSERGPGLHHICYRVTDIEAEMQRLVLQGLRLIDTKPRPGAHNSLIAFLHPKSTEGVLIELCQHR